MVLMRYDDVMGELCEMGEGGLCYSDRCSFYRCVRLEILVELRLTRQDFY